MKLRTLSNSLLALWIVLVVVGGLKVATTEHGQTGTTLRGLLLAGFGSAVALLVVAYLFRATLFSRKPTTQMTAKESAQLAVVFIFALFCIAIVAMVAAVGMR